PGGMAPHTKNALRLGLYQLLYMDGVPDHAAVNETVALAGSRGERGFERDPGRGSGRHARLYGKDQEESGRVQIR
ncbi:MAG: hypothetical protein IIV93_02065, partial [Clostridia bacterium]|nr:hypothetical protein [Clostridia bacterium]